MRRTARLRQQASASCRMWSAGGLCFPSPSSHSLARLNTTSRPTYGLHADSVVLHMPSSPADETKAGAAESAVRACLMISFDFCETRDFDAHLRVVFADQSQSHPGLVICSGGFPCVSAPNKLVVVAFFMSTRTHQPLTVCPHSCCVSRLTMPCSVPAEIVAMYM
jgi:hypothetical protein